VQSAYGLWTASGSRSYVSSAGAAQCPLVERRDRAPLVNQLAARRIHEESAGFISASVRASIRCALSDA
jgi:hypothetical protein